MFLIIRWGWEFKIIMKFKYEKIKLLFLYYDFGEFIFVIYLFLVCGFRVLWNTFMDTLFWYFYFFI